MIDERAPAAPSQRFALLRDGKLIGWVSLISALIAIGYASRAFGSGDPAPDVLFEYSTAVASAGEYVLLVALALTIARGVGAGRLGFRGPDGLARAALLALIALAAAIAVEAALNTVLNAGAEQGLVPSGWDSSRAGAFAANFIVVAIFAPVVEETLYRGVGFTLISAHFRPAVAILVTGTAFGLSHGLVLGLPVLTAFGVVLAWLRWRSGSIYPAIVVHALFNALALVLAVSVTDSPL